MVVDVLKQYCQVSCRDAWFPVVVSKAELPGSLWLLVL